MLQTEVGISHGTDRMSELDRRVPQDGPEGVPPVIDLGDNHTLQWSEYEGDLYAGATVKHLRPDGTPCAGFISIRGGKWSKEFEGMPSHQSWELVQREPLTLSPSLQCRACPDHGFIREGKWVRA